MGLCQIKAYFSQTLVTFKTKTLHEAFKKPINLIYIFQFKKKKRRFLYCFFLVFLQLCWIYLMLKINKLWWIKCVCVCRPAFTHTHTRKKMDHGCGLIIYKTRSCGCLNLSGCFGSTDHRGTKSHWIQHFTKFILFFFRESQFCWFLREISFYFSRNYHFNNSSVLYFNAQGEKNQTSLGKKVKLFLHFLFFHLIQRLIVKLYFL